MRLHLPSIFSKWIGSGESRKPAPAQNAPQQLSKEKLLKLRSRFDAKSWDQTADSDRIAEQGNEREELPR